MTMQAAEWRICFREGMLGKKKEEKKKEKRVHEPESQWPIIWRAFVLGSYGGLSED